MLKIPKHININKWLPYALVLLALALGYFLRPLFENGAEEQKDYLDSLESYRQDSIKYNTLLNSIDQMNYQIDNQIWLYDKSIKKQDEILENLKKQNETIQNKKNDIDSILHSLDAIQRFDRISGYIEGRWR